MPRCYAAAPEAYSRYEVPGAECRAIECDLGTKSYHAKSLCARSILCGTTSCVARTTTLFVPGGKYFQPGGSIAGVVSSPRTATSCSESNR